jgi:hypothetical protein
MKRLDYRLNQLELPGISTGYVRCHSRVSGYDYRVFFSVAPNVRFFYLRRSSTADKSGLPD